MKKKLLIPFIALLGLYIASCQKENEDAKVFTNDTTTVPLDTIITPPVDTTDTTSACDTLDVTFGANIMPIFQQHCVSCHNPTYTGGSGGSGSGSGGTGLEPYLTDYANIVDAINHDPDEFFEMINHTGGEDPMPPTYMLTDCELRQIEIWFEDGMPNN